MQELAELRLRIAKISANVQGVNADNFIKFCNTLEGWVAPVGEDDPLRIGMQSPCSGNCGTNYCDENGCIDKKEVIGSPAPMEIDWSRPQLVKHRHDGYVIKTNGEIGKLTFSGELLINAIQRHYLKKYKSELLFVKSVVSLPQFSELDGAHWLELAPINNQTSIDFEDTEGFGAIVGKVKGKASVPWPDTGGAGRKSAHVKADGVRNRKRQPEAEPEHAVRPVRQLELPIL